MAPKRKRVSYDDNALFYWVRHTGEMRKRASREGARNGSHPSGKLILDAHEWGEAMVRAYLACMADDGVAASDRWNALRSKGKEWYARGYLFYLLPQCADAPEDIATHKCYNEHVYNKNPPPSEATVRDCVILNARKLWWDSYANTIRADAWAALQDAKNAATKKCAAAATTSAPAYASAPASASASASASTSLAPSPMTVSPATAIVAKSLNQGLPPLLARLLKNPASKEPRTPRAGIRELVAAALRSNRMLRVWNEESSNGRKLTLLSKRTDQLANELCERDLGLVCGLGGSDEAAYREALGRGGMRRIGKGGFNSICDANDIVQAAWAVELLPIEVASDFLRKRAVLRCPHGGSDPLSFDEAVSEATNMLFTALIRAGPRVAALGCAPWSAFRRGRERRGYAIYAFLEAGMMSVDRRLTSTTPGASAAESRPYYDALVAAVYRISAEGYVHLDATLRNFIDFYSHELPSTFKGHYIRVIDVDAKHFRRLCTGHTSEWRYLFLFNLLTVLVFLKERLAERWKPHIHWPPRMRAMCEQLISELSGLTNIAAITMWTGAFEDTQAFPDLGKGEFAGDTHEAAKNAAVRTLKHYLLQQPLNEATIRYVNVIKPDPNDPGKVSSGQELDAARRWYDNVYRKQMMPQRAFFLEKLRSPWGAKRFVDVAFEFLDTPLAHMQEKCKDARCSKQHHPGYSRKYLLGIA
ncbi:MAG: hypothetical protein CMB11_08100 [Euryarchaeota archaeon]|nr:hypothetical protein [Euryarchaeota archaeon]